MRQQLALGIDLDIPHDFGHWFAGLVDGEGNFDAQCRVITNPRLGKSCRPMFRIKLRADDRQMLEMIAETLKVGTVYTRDSPANDGVNRNPYAEYVVYRLQNLRHVMIPLFETFPLRSKKEQDFLVWKQIVMLATLPRKGKYIPPARWDEMKELVERLKDGRKYKPDGH